MVGLVPCDVLRETRVHGVEVDDLVGGHPDRGEEGGDREARVVGEVVALLDPVEQRLHARREALGHHGVDVAGEVEVGERLAEVGHGAVERVADGGRDGEGEPVGDAALDRLPEEVVAFGGRDRHHPVGERAVDQPPALATHVGREREVRTDLDEVVVEVGLGGMDVAREVELHEEVVGRERLFACALELRALGGGEAFVGGAGLAPCVAPCQDVFVDERDQDACQRVREEFGADVAVGLADVALGERALDALGRARDHPLLVGERTEVGVELRDGLACSIEERVGGVAALHSRVVLQRGE